MRVAACGWSLWLVASTFASSFDKSTEDEKATVDKRDSGRGNLLFSIEYLLLGINYLVEKLRYERTGLQIKAFWSLRFATRCGGICR